MRFPDCRAGEILRFGRQQPRPPPAGQTAHYKDVPFQLTTQGNQIHVAGTIPTTLADFKIDPPTLLTLPVKNEIPVRVEMTWHQQ